MFLILAENLGEVIDLTTKTHLDSVAIILAEATQIVQQAVLMNHFALTNMVMHRTTTADQSGHGYHWVMLFNLMVLRNWLHLRILQLPLYSLYSLSGEGWKSGWSLQTWECTLSYNTVQLGTKSEALKCHGISTTFICPAWITASDCFRWSICY